MSESDLAHPLLMFGKKVLGDQYKKVQDLKQDAQAGKMVFGKRVTAPLAAAAPQAKLQPVQTERQKQDEAFVPPPLVPAGPDGPAGKPARGQRPPPDPNDPQDPVVTTATETAPPDTDRNQPDEPLPPMSIAELGKALEANTSIEFFDQVMNAEIERPDGHRKGAVTLLIRAEEARGDAKRPDVIAELQALSQHSV